jgi:hypothetical protein
MEGVAGVLLGGGFSVLVRLVILKKKQDPATLSGQGRGTKLDSEKREHSYVVTVGAQCGLTHYILCKCRSFFWLLLVSSAPSGMHRQEFSKTVWCYIHASQNVRLDFVWHLRMELILVRQGPFVS